MWPHIIEVKRVHDVFQYIFSGEDSMCWHVLYILSTLPLIPKYRWKDVIRLEVIDYASNEGLSWQDLGEDVNNVAFDLKI